MSQSRSETARRLWQDPSFRARASVGLDKTTRSPDWPARRREAMQRRWSDPSTRARHSERMKQVARRNRAKVRAYWTPERRRQASVEALRRHRARDETCTCPRCPGCKRPAARWSFGRGFCLPCWDQECVT